jgi:hypothetical protein
MTDDELWHVRMSPQEVKQLTLEQLDDLFRLDIIEADTLIWQPGMTEWLPLSVVAGLGDEDPEPVNIAVSQPPAPQSRLAQTQTAWPPVARSAPPSTAPAPPSVRSAPPPLSQRPVPPSLSSRPAPPPLSQRPVPPSLSSRPAPPPLSQRPAPPPLSQRPAPPSSQAGVLSSATSWPPSSAWSNPPPRAVPSSHAPDPFAHTAAAAFTTAPVIRMPRGTSGGGSWLILLSLAAGAAVTLYRNDLVHAAMRSVGQEGSFVKLESALGGPSFGTPRAVAQMAAATAALTVAAPVSGTTTTESSPSTASTTNGASSAASTSETPKPAEIAAAEAPKPAETAAAEPSKPADPPKAETSKPAEAHRPAAPAARPASHAASTAEAIDPVFKTPKKGKKSKGNEYDPLNPSL